MEFQTVHCPLRSCHHRHDPNPRVHYGPTGIPHTVTARIQDASRKRSR